MRGRCISFLRDCSLSMAVSMRVQLEGSETRNRVRIMGKGVRNSQCASWLAFRRIMLWNGLLLQLITSVVTAQQQMGPPSVNPSVSGVSENSTVQAEFIPMFGAPGDIDTSLNGGSLIRLRLERHSACCRIRNQVAEINFSWILQCRNQAPGGNSAGIVTAFYASNGGYYPYNHDEIDIEFLGVRPGQPYVVQTNIYADGSTGTGREERFHLWFDPTADYHNYSILWTYHHIVIFVDDIPIRRYVYLPELGIKYPAKPMTAYATIWDGSTWATEGGQYPVNYTQGPFDVTFTNFKLEGCVWDPALQITPPECALSNYKAWFNDNGLQAMSDQQMIALDWARSNFMWYTYCDDRQRYPVQPPPECPQTLGNLNSIVTSDSTPSARKGPWRNIPKSKPVTRPMSTTTHESIATSIPSSGQHKLDKKRISPTESGAFHYLPFSLWKTEFPVELRNENFKH